MTASKNEQSPWLQTIQRWERAIGEPIERAVRSDEYFDLMTQVNRARARVTRAFEEASEEWLHRVNLPAASDFRRLREQLSRLERQVNQIAKDLEDRNEPLPKPRRAAPRKKPGKGGPA